MPRSNEDMLINLVFQHLREDGVDEVMSRLAAMLLTLSEMHDFPFARTYPLSGGSVVVRPGHWHDGVFSTRESGDA